MHLVYTLVIRTNSSSHVSCRTARTLREKGIFRRPRNTNQNRKWPRSLFRRSSKERSGAGWDQDGPGWPPPLGPGWVPNAVKQSTWRIWTGPLRTRDGTWMGPAWDPGESLDGTPRDSNRLLGLSDKSVFKENAPSFRRF